MADIGSHEKRFSWECPPAMTKKDSKSCESDLVVVMHMMGYRDLQKARRHTAVPDPAKMCRHSAETRNLRGVVENRSAVKLTGSRPSPG